MPQGRHTSLTIHLTAADRQTLLAWQRSTTIRAGLARRGRILLLLADRMSITQIATTVGSTRRFVYKWVQRFQAHGLAGLTDTPRPGPRRGTRQHAALPHGREGHAGDVRGVDVLYAMAVSLDGYLAPADGTLAWLAPFAAGGEDDGSTAWYAAIDVVLLGRHTFEQAVRVVPWPYPHKPCWVFSPRRLPVTQPDVEVTTRSPRQVLGELAARGYRRAWLVGGGQLAGTFRAQGLLTEYRITVLPIILGTGMPLFGAVGPPEPLSLVASQVLPNGLVHLHYRRAGRDHRLGHPEKKS